MIKGYFTLIIMLFSLALSATHNRAGEITYIQTGPSTIKVTVTTYTKASSEAKRPQIGILWGDGTTDTLNRSLNYPQNVGQDIEKSIYEGTHTYPAPSTYTISFEDPNRNADVNNVPLSVETPFYVESTIIINPFLGLNSSVQLLNPPIENACKDVLFIHNPSPFDEDGDSLTFELIHAKGKDGQEVPGYFLPNGVSIDNNNGSLIWDKPSLTGEFNFAILIKEWRNGFLIGSIIRDLQVTVKECDNSPPVIDALKDTCVVAGSVLSFTVNAIDPDSTDIVTLSATGGPFEVEGTKALFTEKNGIPSVSSIFQWGTECGHVRQSSYQVNFQAKDNDGNVPLIDLEIINITVIGPKVENPTVQSDLNGINLNWSQYNCQNIIGYKIYRKIDSTQWTPDYCETGVPESLGYVNIGNSSSLSDTAFVDSSAVSGITYCYRIVACFPDGSEGIASDEVCAEKLKVEPIPIHASVRTTDVANGSILVQWINPPEIDSLNLTGSVSYTVSRFSTSNTNVTVVYTSVGSTDTSFIDTLLNTNSEQYTYIINLLIDGVLINSSSNFSSTFVSIGEFDKVLKLSWAENTPWNNYLYVIHKESFPGSQVFNAIDTTTELIYVDDSLMNGTQYCYKIETLGAYSALNEYDSLINFSQIICGVPIDTIPPCAPSLSLGSNCEGAVNTIFWSYKNSDCDGDLGSIKIYYKPTLNGSYEFIYETSDLSQNQHILSNLNSVAGCYLITGVDTVGNESSLLNDTCVDNCPIYELPNVITPNGDELNDLLIPLKEQYIDKIEFNLYNRWGTQVFATTDKNIKWDGRVQTSNQLASAGIYFYTCTIFELRLTGIIERRINGFLYVLR